MEKLNKLRIALASDHAGYNLKKRVEKYLLEKGAFVHDYGCHSTESCDYPDFAHPMASAVEDGLYDFGIAICSTGNGITMSCNHHKGIRAALCWDTQLADLGRRHNNANVLSMPANFISEEKAIEIVETFFNTDFEGGRHERRVNKIPC